MKLKELTIQAIEELSESELMLVNEWVNQLRESRRRPLKPVKWKISYEQLHAATKRCRNAFSEEISSQREDRV
jgi:hypothetical protein